MCVCLMKLHEIQPELKHSLASETLAVPQGGSVGSADVQDGLSGWLEVSLQIEGEESWVLTWHQSSLQGA